MKKAKTSSVVVMPRWAMSSFVAVVLVFAGFTTYQMVTAATFDEPGCDPTATAGPSACNKSAPLFLDPTDGADQTVQTGINLASGKSLGVAGNINLNSGAQLRTPSELSGTAINVTSSNYAIIGNSSSSSHAGIFANGTSGAVGLYAVSDTGVGLSAKSISGGSAAYFEGPVRFMLANSPSTYATFTVDSVGDLNISTSVPGKGLKINNASVGAGQKTFNLTGTGGNGVAVEYPDIKNALGSNQYVVTDIRVMYADGASATDRHWKPLATTAYTYKECTGSTWSSKLEITNPVASPIYRITYSVDATQTFACPGAAPVPSFSLTPNSANIAAFTNVTTASTGVNSGLTSTWTVNGVSVCTGTNPSGTCSFTNSVVTVSNTLAAPTFVFKTGITHTITLNNGNATVPSATVNSYLANMAQVSLRSPATNYSVNFNNTSTPSPVTGLVCDWNFGSGFSGTYSACTTPQSNNFVTGGNKTVYLRVKKTAGDTTYSEKQTTFELCTAANQATDCASGICAASGYCVLGGGGGGLPID